MNILQDFDLTGIEYPAVSVPLKLHSLISDHALFQRDKPIRIFGTASPFGLILAKLLKDGDPTQSMLAYSFADELGDFVLELPALYAGFETYTLVVSDTVNEKKIVDLLIGEVWVLGGQSNMGIRVREMDGGVQAMSEAAESQIRIFYQSEGLNAEAYPYVPDKDVKMGIWKRADTGSNIAECSAVGYTFAVELFYTLYARGEQVPIAILNTQKGGSSIHSWLPRQAIVDTPQIRDFVISKGYPLDESGWNQREAQNYNQTSALFNRKVAPLFNFNVKGVVWYQGENDPLYDPTIYAIPLLMETWSEGFNRNDELLPFVLIQLHPYDGSDPFLGESTKNYTSLGYPGHRLAQFEIARSEAYKDSVVVIPIYDVSLLWNVPTSQFQWKSVIHPVTKRPVGERAAKAVWTAFYGGNIDYRAPLLSEVSFAAQSITMTFDHVGMGLRTFKDSSQGVTTVEIHLTNGVRQTVTCEIVSGNQIRITGVDTSTVVSVSYSHFTRNEASNLASSYNVPVIPFKVDLR
jgi:sialate O-acetylesterase